MFGRIASRPPPSVPKSAGTGSGANTSRIDSSAFLIPIGVASVQAMVLRKAGERMTSPLNTSGTSEMS